MNHEKYKNIEEYYRGEGFEKGFAAGEAKAEANLQAAIKRLLCMDSISTKEISMALGVKESYVVEVERDMNA